MTVKLDIPMMTLPNGTGIKMLSPSEVMAWWLGGMPDGELTVEDVYERIGAVRAAITLRAQALAGLPWELRNRRNATVPYDTEALSSLIEVMEIDYCLYGAAYVLRDPAALLGLRRIHPRTIRLDIDPATGTATVVRQLGERIIRLAIPDEVLAWWSPPIRSEVGHGPGLVVTAMTEARLVASAQQYQAAYFERGALRPTVWTFPSRPSEAERNRFEGWLRQVLSGIRNAFRHVALSSEVKPVTLGDKLTDVIQPDVIDRAMQTVLTAFHVPHSLILSSAANYATARQDWLNFILLTVLPHARRLVAVLAPHFAAQGVTLVINEARIEAVQQMELDKAQAIRSMAGTILTMTEARERLNLDPLEDQADEINRMLVMQRLTIVQQAVGAGLPMDVALSLAGLDIQLPPDEAEAGATAEAEAEAPLPEADEIDWAQEVGRGI